MLKATLTGEKATLTGENLPRVGKHRKRDLKARQDLDLREREVFKLRRDGHTFQEITDLLSERAKEILESTGLRINYYSSASGVKKAFDRYLMRSPERSDLEGRKEELELAILRAEENYKNALERSHNSLNADGFIEESMRARWSDVAGKWFDRLVKLRGLDDDTTIMNSLSRHTTKEIEVSLIEKISGFIEKTPTPDTQSNLSPVSKKTKMKRDLNES